MTMKKLLAGSVLALTATGVAAIPSDLADLKNDSGSKLLPDVPQDTYYDTGAGYVSLTDTSGLQDDSNAELLAESADLETGNSFGIFDPENGNELTLFSGTDTKGTGVTVKFDVSGGTAKNQTTGASEMIGTTFGFFIDNGNGNKFYSDPDMNDSLDPALIYDTTGTSGEGLSGANLVVAFEDQQVGDRDYNDMVVGLTDVVAEVPEPGTLALFGIGLLGLGVSRFRQAA